jgi:hypothetical protein
MQLGYLTLPIDRSNIEDGAEAWWRGLSPATRGVFLQALWEIQGEPEPRTQEEEKAA